MNKINLIPKNPSVMHENIEEESCTLNFEFGEQLILPEGCCDEDFLLYSDNTSLSVPYIEQTSEIELDSGTLLFEDENEVGYFQRYPTNEESSSLVKNASCYLVGNPITLEESSTESAPVDNNLKNTFQYSPSDNDFLVTNVMRNNLETEDISLMDENCSNFYLGLNDQILKSNVHKPTNSKCKHVNKNVTTAYLPSANQLFKDNSNNNNNITPHLDVEANIPTVIIDQSRVQSPKKSREKNNIVQVEVYQEEKQTKEAKKYVCQVCRKTFTRAYNLRVHQRLHTGEAPYTCKICNSKFRDSSQHKRHEKMCQGMYNYKCAVCKKVPCLFNMTQSFLYL